MRDTAVIGAGASGLMAALFAGKRGLSITVFEKKEQPGKKLLVTGNGRCNYSNVDMDPGCYYSPDPSFIQHFLESFSPEEARQLFFDLGLLTEERNGGLYPASGQASSVVSVLTQALKPYDVQIITDTEVTGIRKEKDHFEVRCEDRIYSFRSVVLACGSPSGVKDRRPFNAYRLLKDLGHTVTEPCPALVRLTGQEGYESQWDGVRIRASVSYEKCFFTGVVQLTKTGVSGIPVFQLSHPAVRALEKKKPVRLLLDFLPGYEEEDLLSLFEKASAIEETGTFLRGLLPSRLIPVVLRRSGIKPSVLISQLDQREKQTLIRMIKAFDYPVKGHGDFMDSQVTSGGVPLEEIKDTFESKRVPGLFITGELLDADGICGGYNLHFAFGSGKTAGEQILKGTC